MSVAEILRVHREMGRMFTAGGVQSFVREEGHGPAIVCVHGMVGSSFLYRKLLRELASRGLRGIAWDLPGFGLAGRPEGYDYSWTGLGKFCVAAVDELGLDRYHLVVHDIGGPVGFELATARPQQVASLTLLDTMVDVTEFEPPWSMRPFRRRGLGAMWMWGLSRPAFRFLMRMQGIADGSSVSNDELDACRELLKGPDRGRAFLKVMRGAERSPEKQARYRRAVRGPYPVQIIWGEQDPALELAVYGEKARAAAGLASIQVVRGKHFLQEDAAPAIAERVADIVERSTRAPELLDPAASPDRSLHLSAGRQHPAASRNG